jgi:Fic family protein
MTHDNERIFTPPPYKEIQKRIDELCNFANSDTDKTFTHPVIKAVIIHFLLSYIHPFTDGNGRTARALFYWFMLKKGYWLAEFISISRILKKAPAKYALSYLYTETDENDLTYFIDFQLETIKKSIDELNIYIKRKMKELESMEKLLRETGLSSKLNSRQVTFLKTAIKSPGDIYTIQEYSNMNNVVYQTARNDLLELSDTFDLLLKLKKGKTFVFVAPSDIENRLKKSKS